MTAILGISAYYHDSAAAVVVDGDIVAAAQEERFTRIKHDHDFPKNAIAYCLAEAGLQPSQLHYVAFYDKPLVKFERLLETYLAYAPRGFRSFVQAMPLWLKKKLHLRREIRSGLTGEYAGPIIFCDHHESHAASAFFPSPFEEAAILTIDGVGEWSTATYGVGQGNRISLSHELRFPHSLGLLYSAFTYYTGFKVNSGEYKVMGLAPYGNPVYKDAILQHLLDLKEDGSFRLDMRYFNYCQGLTMTSERFHRLFGGPPRKPESRLTQREMDLAASIQAVTEEIMLRMARHVHRVTGQKNLVLAGGVALNCVGNGRILREGPFERIWIQPAAGDAGGALGAALFTWHQLLGRPRQVRHNDAMHGALLGPRYDPQEVADYLDLIGAVHHSYDDEEALLDHVADLLAQEKVVGWVQGRMEFGPRALGCRSILGDARSPRMQSVMNLKIKFRESFRPFAPVVLREHVDEYFQMRPGEDSPYMLLVAPVQERMRLPNPRSADGVPEMELEGIARLQVPRSVIPAVTHVDYSARVQTVDPQRHGRFYRLLKRFYHKTGCPVLINTSFNVRGEPIVCSPADAYRCFMGTNMDVLVIENQVLYKHEQPREHATDRRQYLAQFALD
jgi:carbamoyltransferase